MPAVVQYNAKTTGVRYADIARSLGLVGSNDEKLVAALVEKLRQMNTSFGIPLTLKDAGLAEERFTAELREMSEAALGDPCTGTNPRKPTVEEIMEIFKAAYYGKDLTI